MERLVLGIVLLGVALLISGVVKLLPTLWRLYVRRTSGDPLTFSRNDGRNTLLYFYTEHCVPCKALQAPALERLSEAYPGRFSLVEVNALENDALARRFHILTVPSTVVLGEDGRVIDANLGYAPAKKLAVQLGLETVGTVQRSHMIEG